MVDDSVFMSQEQDYSFNAKIRDLEERHGLMKDRMLLLGENLIDFREETVKEISDMKSMIEKISDDIERMKGVLRRMSEEIDTKSRKEDLEILRRQAKMFEPLKLATLEDVAKMIQESRR
jgi:hypothetical protein